MNVFDPQHPASGHSQAVPGAYAGPRPSVPPAGFGSGIRQQHVGNVQPGAYGSEMIRGKMPGQYNEADARMDAPTSSMPKYPVVNGVGQGRGNYPPNIMPPAANGSQHYVNGVTYNGNQNNEMQNANAAEFSQQNLPPHQDISALSYNMATTMSLSGSALVKPPHLQGDHHNAPPSLGGGPGMPPVSAQYSVQPPSAHAYPPQHHRPSLPPQSTTAGPVQQHDTRSSPAQQFSNAPGPGVQQLPPSGAFPTFPGQPRPPGPLQQPPQQHLPPGQPTSFSGPAGPGQHEAASMPPMPGHQQQRPGPIPGQMPQMSGQNPAALSRPGAPGAIPHSARLPGAPGSFVPGQMPPMPGSQFAGQNVHAMPGQMMQQPGQMPQMSCPAMPGPIPGQMSSRPGQMPPMPGQMPSMSGGMPPMPGGVPPMPSAPMGLTPQAQSRKLDPSAMPSAIQVIEDDKSRSGPFPTGFPRAEQAPLVTTEIISEDQGNCSPSFIRSTLYQVPISSDLLKQSGIPFGLCITPLARQNVHERPPPVIDLGELGPVRCHRCKAYMCPFMEFNDGGRRFKCPFCRSSSEVPTEYFAHLDHTGRRIDILDRPEMFLGSYEYVATKMYCKNQVYPKPPAYIFMLDVSYNAVRTGLLHVFCRNIKQLLSDLPREFNVERSFIEVGFATYDQSIHFYNLKSKTGQPKMLVVGDVNDMFVPLGDTFFVRPDEADAVLTCLLEQIPDMFSENRTTDVILGPVIKAGMEALKAADRSGKVFLFHTSLPLLEAPGKLKNRDDRKLLGTDKEKQILTPLGDFYGDLAKECVSAGCCVDAFLFPNAYIDIATIGSLCATTGGTVYKYPYFHADVDGSRFINDLGRDISKPVIFDCLMRVRTSTGIRATDFFGNFYMSNTTDVEIAALDADKAVTVEIKYDDKLEENEGAFIQVAVLFTSAGGQRRLRIHNLSLGIATDLAALYRSADLDSVINFTAKQSERHLLHKSPREIRETLVSQCAKILACYRSKVAQPSSAGQLILPEGMKLLPLYTNCIIKHAAFSGGSEVNTDDRSWLMQIVASMRVFDSLFYFYPRLIPLMEDDDDGSSLPGLARTYYENLRIDSAYFLENGVVMFMWIGSEVSQQWLSDVFGIHSLAQLNPEQHDIPDKDNSTSRKVRRIYQRLQDVRPRSMKLYVVHPQHKLESWFKQFLVEDKGSDSAPSYVDFLCHIHKEIRTLLE